VGNNFQQNTTKNNKERLPPSIPFTAPQRCNKRFLRFLFRSRFFTFLKIFFYVFYFKKTLSNAKYEYAKIQRKILLKEA